MNDVRLMPCEGCGSEGRILRSASGRANDPYDIDCGPCVYCDGTGMALIEVEPIEECDLARSDHLKEPVDGA